MTNSRSDRRSATRVSCDLEVSMTLLQRDGTAEREDIPARLRNLSATGGRLHSADDIANGATLDLRIALPELPLASLAARALKVRAKVIWILEEREPDGRPFGVEFQGLKPADESDLEERLKAMRRA